MVTIGWHALNFNVGWVELSKPDLLATPLLGFVPQPNLQ